jgi:predicted TIM-barrel fold metal-dependent hydrolase
MTYRPFDADNHYFEPRNLFVDYIDPQYRDLALRTVRDSDGIERLYAGSAAGAARMPVEWPVFDEAPLPGALHENMRKVASGDGVYMGNINHHQLQPMRKEYIDRSARLELLKAQGLEGALLFPSLGVTIEKAIQDDKILTYANLRAFNRWLKEEWGYADDEHLLSVPMLSFIDRDLALKEVEMVLDDGARAVHLRPGPQGRRAPGDPYFDAIWSRLNEAGTLIIFHQSRTDYEDRISPWWADSEPIHAHSAFKHLQYFGDRPVMDSIASMILHNVFGRFPNLKLAIIEHGSSWVGYLLKALNHAAAFSIKDLWLGGKLDERPGDIFRRHVWVAPYPEENAKSLVELIGADHVLFGSDFPHSEGMAEPITFVKKLDGLSDDAVAQVMGDNIRELLHIQ